MKLFAQGFLICSLAAALIACQQDVSREVTRPVVTVMVLPELNHQAIQSFPAVIQAKDLTDLSFRQGGEIVQLNLKAGQLVKEGELLARLDDTNFKLTVKDKQAKADLLNVQKERSKAMVAQGNMAQSTYDQLEAKYQVALAELNIAKKNLSYIEMKAPFEGVISSVTRENHETVQAGQSVLVLHRVDLVEVAVDLPDYVVARAHRASPDSPQAHAITVKLDAFPNQVFQAHYLEHTAEHTSANRTYRLILEMPLDPARPFFQGMSGNIEVDMNKLHLQFRNHFMVPGEAIVVPDEVPLKSGKRWIWRLKSDQTVEPVEVAVGGFKGNLYEVSGSLRAGDRIVLRGQSGLQAGLAVNVLSEGNQI